jgi:GntR family transcriptional regulator
LALTIDVSDSRPIYVQIMDEVKRGIVLGTWRTDEALPSVRQLAVELRINPNTVQQAYRELEREGVVYVRRGQGTYITEADPVGPRRDLLDGLAQRVLQEARRHGFETDELIDALRSHAGRNGSRGATSKEV